MDNASDYGSEDSRFESWHARFHFRTPIIQHTCQIDTTPHDTTRHDTTQHNTIQQDSSSFSSSSSSPTPHPLEVRYVTCISRKRGPQHDSRKRAKGSRKVSCTNGEAGYRSQYLSHAKRALCHLSYIPDISQLTISSLLPPCHP